MIWDYFSLKDKSGIVTGAGTGIGKGMAQGLAEAGAAVVIAGRNLDRLKGAAEELSDLTGSRVIPLQVDMASHADIEVLVERAIEQAGKIDFLFNNAGTIYRTPSEDFPMEQWLRVLQINLTGPFYLSQLAARHMIAQKVKGSIVNTSSLLAVFGGKTVPAYAASKGGLTQATKTMCNDWGRYGIRANAIAPGWIATEMTDALRKDQGRFNEISARIPLSRWGDPKDFMGPAVFLASEASAYISGHVLFVDGGYMAM
ncbi:MAG: SDR family oxidoreductase [Desulfarculaceae bacterium]